MATSLLKELVYKELSRVTHAISNPKRLELIDVLSQKPYSVEELSKEISMTISSTSQHLQVLKSAKLVQATRQGNFIIYSISDENILHLVLAIRELGFRKYAEIERLLNDFKVDRKILESITLEDFRVRSKKEDILLIDVRPEDEFLAGHIQGAISIPLNQLKNRMNNLPEDKTIVAYCRGPLCVMASEAVELLQKNNFDVLLMEEGYIDWKLSKEN